jgi:hypothetical protein
VAGSTASDALRTTCVKTATDDHRQEERKRNENHPIRNIRWASTPPLSCRDWGFRFPLPKSSACAMFASTR